MICMPSGEVAETIIALAARPNHHCAGLHDGVIPPSCLALLVAHHERTGTKYVGPIHGRLMAYTSLAALTGPTLLLTLRSMSEMTAMKDLVGKVDPARFQEAFNTRVEDVQTLFDVSFVVCLLAAVSYILLRETTDTRTRSWHCT